jgi:hypothetical protein
MKKVLIATGVVLLIGVPLAVLWRVSDTCDDFRCQLAEVMPRIARIQKDVESTMSAKPNGWPISPTGEISYGYVGKDGSIVAIAGKYKLVILAQPTSTTKPFEWKCRAFPEKANSVDLIADCGKMFRAQ